MKTDAQKIVLMGVGNILLSDEGLGVHIVNELAAEYEFSQNLRVVDGGALSAHLIPTIKDADILLIVDCLDAKDEPASVYRFTYDDIKTRNTEVKTSMHQFSIMEILDMAKTMGYSPHTIVIGVQPEDIRTLNIGCTEAISAKFPFVKDLVVKELEKLGVTARKRKVKLPVRTL